MISNTDFGACRWGPGDFVQFAPGTVHRSVNNERLTVLAIMGNAGLAERGDARIWFGPEVDADPERYQQFWRLPAAAGLGGALDRRDHSVSAYMELLRLWERIAKPIGLSLSASSVFMRGPWQPLRERFQDVVSLGPAKVVAIGAGAY